MIDLEDAIDQSRRSEAHALLRSLAGEIAGRPTHVRVAVGVDGYAIDDIELAASLGAEAIRLPKAEDPGSVAAASKVLDNSGSGAVVHLTVESARGLSSLESLVPASERVSRVVFGERDFLADVGVDEPGPITDHARASLAILSRSFDLETPLDGAYIDLEDPDGLRRSCEHARSLGFGGKSALHPKQLQIIHEVFSPSPEQLARAQEIVEAFDAARARGEVMVIVGGRFVDEAVARRARAVLEDKEVGS